MEALKSAQDIRYDEFRTPLQMDFSNSELTALATQLGVSLSGMGGGFNKREIYKSTYQRLSFAFLWSTAFHLHPRKFPYFFGPKIISYSKIVCVIV